MISVIEMFSYDFFVRAVIAGALVALCAALLGVPLVLKRYSMIGDGLSHVGFGALSVALAMNVAPLAVSIPVVALAAFLLLRLSESGRIKGDAAIALVSSSSLAIGIIVTSQTTGFNVDVYGYMFGSILSMSPVDFWLCLILSLVVLLLFALLYHKIFAITFDADFAMATGAHAKWYNLLLAMLTALIVVLGMRIMGALLISSLIIFPALSAMRLSGHFKGVMLLSAGVSLLCFLLGMVASFAFSIPAGASVVAANLAAFLLCSLLGKLGRRSSLA